MLNVRDPRISHAVGKARNAALFGYSNPTVSEAVVRLNKIITLTKIDVERRLVSGIATAEVVDRSDEIMDYASSKPNFERWSAEVHADTDGKSLGNLRAMHGAIAAGKITDIEFDDDGRQISVTAKVVDDNEWSKVLEGVYTGFSVGGRYARKWDDCVNGKKVTRFTADPSEISLVDRPCLPDAKITDIAKSMQIVGVSPEVLVLYRKYLPLWKACVRRGREIRKREQMAKVARNTTDALFTSLFSPVLRARLTHRPRMI